MPESILSLNRSRNGNRSSDGSRCLRSAMGLIEMIHRKRVDTKPPNLPSLNFVLAAVH